MKRPIYIGIGAVCLVLTAIVITEMSVAISDEAMTPGAGSQDVSSAGDEQSADDPDTMVTSILDRPIFAPDRRGPPAPKGADMAASAADKAGPEIRGRLAGVTIGPGERREAVFARGEGEKPLVVREGDDVDGWTVSSIESGRVLLTSTFGQRTIEPTFGAAGDTPPPVRKTPTAKDVVNAEPANPAMPQGPGNRRAGSRIPPPGAAPVPGANPIGRRAPPIPPARRKDSN
jgi:hypothetical protein